jgi:phosphatidate cytidylyltransferase
LARGPSEGGQRWNDLGKRLASAVVLVPLALGCLWYGGLPFAMLVTLAGFGLAVEWVQLCRERPAAWPAALVLASIVLVSVLAALGLYGLALGVIVVGGGILLLLPSATRLSLAGGVPYIAPTALALIWLRDDPVAGWSNVLFVLVLIWSSDIGAYLAGRLIGGPRLAPLISPGKTWSGAVGGLIAAVVFGWLTASALHSPVAPLRLMVLAVGLGIVSQAGDLFESLLKRHFGVKDSGRLIPGHGGLLDRLDALLAVAPVAAVLVFMTGRGVVLWQ